jgi:hypothetical protein
VVVTAAIARRKAASQPAAVSAMPR